MLLASALLSWLPVPLPVLGTASAEERALVLAPVHVVSPETASVERGRAVRVEGGVVVAIGAADDGGLRRGAEVIDAGGAYLLPGLFDMHVHLNEGEEDLLELWLASGITTVQGMHGGPHQLDVMHRVEKGELLGPRVLSTGPTTARERVHTEMDARHHVMHVASEDFHAVKMYGDGSDTMPEATYRLLIELAHESGLKVVGHAPRNLPFRIVLEAGQDSIDHMEEIVYTHEPFQHLLGPYVAMQFGRDAFTEHPELVRPDVPDLAALLADEIAELAAEVKAAGLVVTPTLTTFASIQAATDDGIHALAASAELRHVHPLYRRRWAPESNRFRNGGWARALPFVSSWLRRAHELQKALARAFHGAGVPLMAGTDAPFQYVIPGASLHDELELLVACGLTPAEALACATSVPARFLGLEDSGRVAPGARADLVLVREDPLADVRNARDVLGVVVAGRWIPEEELSARLDRRAAALAAEEELTAALFAAVEAEDLEALPGLLEEIPAGDVVLAPWVETSVNSIGYGRLRSGDVDAALEVFELNVELFPDAFNAWDSLAEATEASGDLELARTLYERSLELNPLNENAQRKVAELAEELAGD